MQLQVLYFSTSDCTNDIRPQRHYSQCLKKEEIYLKKTLIILFVLGLLFIAVIAQHTCAMEPIGLVAVYSASSPSIDGQLHASEWWDAAAYKFNATGSSGDVLTWMYIKHNGSHLYLGFVVWQIYINAFDEFSIYFDEGNSSIHGSGTRDFNLIVNQEDAKSVSGTNATGDGCWKADPTQFHMFDVEIDFEAKSLHENDHAAAEWEIENLEGLGWVDDHWECEFSIPLVGNDEGIQDISDLVCAVGDTIGFKFQYFVNPGAKNYYYPAGTQNQVLNYTNLWILDPPVIESCDVSGARKDGFAVGESVYVNGSGFAPLVWYDFYVVDDVENWINGTSIPTRVLNTAINVSTDAAGRISPAAAWNNTDTVGAYDMIIDLNKNGVYDVGIDVLDDNDVEVTAGFVVPEFASATAIAALFIIATLLVAVRRNRKEIEG